MAFHRLPKAGWKEAAMINPEDLPEKWRCARVLPLGCIQLKRTLKESVMKETELANTLTAVAEEEVNNVWKAIGDKPEEAMGLSQVTTRLADEGNHMQAVMTKTAREAKEKEMKDKEKKDKEGKATKLRQSTIILARNPSNASSS